MARMAALRLFRQQLGKVTWLDGRSLNERKLVAAATEIGLGKSIEIVREMEWKEKLSNDLRKAISCTPLGDLAEKLSEIIDQHQAQ